MNRFRGGSRIRDLRRLWEISRVLARHGFGGLFSRLTGRRRPESAADGARTESVFPQRLRMALEELGPSFIKLGQLLSTRADMLPPAYVEELKKLQDQVPPEPTPVIRTQIETQLGRPLEEAFAAFDDSCLAAASVAQVHTATLNSGERVAVKVIRPNIERRIRKDIGLMYSLARKLEKRLEMARILGAVNVVAEFERTIFQELDMHVEAGSLEKFGQYFRRTEEIHIPRVYWELTTKSVLVMEYVPGVKVDRVEQIRAQGIDPQAVALIGLRSLSRQLMEFGCFHADPHPGNTIVMPDGRVGLVDFGIMGYLEEEMMRQVANVFLGYAEHDYDLVLDALRGAGVVDEENIDMPRFRQELKEISEPFYGRSLQTISVREVYDQVMQIVRNHRIVMPRNLLLLLKTMIQTESLGKILGSEASILEVMKPYAKELIQRGYDSQRVFQRLERDVRAVGGLMRSAPRYLHDILRRTAQGRQRLEFRHTGFGDMNRKFEKGINRLVVGFIISASTIAGSLVLNSPQKVIEFEVDLFGIQTFSLTALLGVTGYTIATVLGVWLILSIFRSEKL